MCSVTCATLRLRASMAQAINTCTCVVAIYSTLYEEHEVKIGTVFVLVTLVGT